MIKPIYYVPIFRLNGELTMPVLDRYKGESIMIGDNIKITILGRKGDEVRIGIQAPRNIKIIRAELTPKDVSPKVNKAKQDS